MNDWKIILKELSCPRATKDLKFNTKNRNMAIKDEDIKYGPLNLDDEKYWEKLAEHWDTTSDVAKKSKCSNCMAFDISPRMKECMPIEDVKGGLGYCWMHDFKCHEDRTCYTWAKGGAITSDKKSKKNQMKREEKDIKKFFRRKNREKIIRTKNPEKIIRRKQPEISERERQFRARHGKSSSQAYDEMEERISENKKVMSMTDEEFKEHMANKNKVDVSDKNLPF